MLRQAASPRVIDRATPGVEVSDCCIIPHAGIAPTERVRHHRRQDNDSLSSKGTRLSSRTRRPSAASMVLLFPLAEDFYTKLWKDKLGKADAPRHARRRDARGRVSRAGLGWMGAYW